VARAHVIGLLLGTEEDWPTAFEQVVARLPRVSYGGETHTFSTERITNEPFDLRAVPRYSVVIDRLAYWYDLPREWLKKIALMDGVYLLNNPFTFQAMEKHSAYCAMMRLGLKVPETWLIPHRVPPRSTRWEGATERFGEMAAKYNPPFDLDEIAERIGYPLYMKPFDGGQWVGVTRVANRDELHRCYDASGERLMHVQAAVEDYDLFARCLSIGAETEVLDYDPARPGHDRYAVRRNPLPPELECEVVTIARLVAAFFRWEFNSSETVVKGADVYPIDYANASPDVALVSLHYYFPWAIRTLVKWAVFCSVSGRAMRLNQATRPFFDVGDRGDLTYEEKLREYRRLADDYLQIDEYEDFCAAHLGDLDEIVVDFVESPAFDHVLVGAVGETFSGDERAERIERYRKVFAAWADEQRARVA
jgi:hypothetical protein